MTPASAQYPYQSRFPGLGTYGQQPYLPLTLGFQKQSISVLGLVDSGSDVNVLPYDVGIQLGLQWDQQLKLPPLGGNLATVECRSVFATANISPFSPVKLMFAWAGDPNVPVLLGQMDFFEEFDVCFFRSQLMFELRRI